MIYTGDVNRVLIYFHWEFAFKMQLLLFSPYEFHLIHEDELSDDLVFALSFDENENTALSFCWIERAKNDMRVIPKFLTGNLNAMDGEM